MSLSIDHEFQEVLKKAAKKRNVTTSKLIRDILEKNLSDEGDTVIFKIPSSIKTCEADLRSWFEARIDAVVQALFADVSKPKLK